jgi:hypothetical protein
MPPHDGVICIAGARTCSASRPIGPDVREFCRMVVGRGKKRFDFALLAAGCDAGGKSPRAVVGVRSPGRKLGGQLLVDGNIVESAEAILQVLQAILEA